MQTCIFIHIILNKSLDCAIIRSWLNLHRGKIEFILNRNNKKKSRKMNVVNNALF